jgi:ribonuclease PH
MQRSDGRENDELRPVTITRGYLKYAEGSCLVEVGDTRVLCAASVEERVPQWLRGQMTGWITAEYAMLPRAAEQRSPREHTRPSGRTAEIQRLVGRALRSVVALETIGERSIFVDCDVIQADGGTRTAAITGGYVALVECLRWMQERNYFRALPIAEAVAAVSVGVVQGEDLLDLTYQEDSMAAVDLNLVMTTSGRIVEVQGTAEGRPFERDRLNRLIDLGSSGITQLIEAQMRALGDL